jgi:DNA repair protein RadC
METPTPCFSRPPLRARERLTLGGPAELDEAELLAVILATGTTGLDALEVARELVARFGDLPRLARAALGELQQVPGVGPAKAARVQAALELGRRCASHTLGPRESVCSSRQVVACYAPLLAHLDREHFYALLLDAKHRKIRDVCVSVGSLDSAIVHPREVFRPAVAESAAAVIVIHNHPSGDPSPSAEDRAVTRRLVATAELLGVELLDHVIIARDGSSSLRDLGMM